MPKNNGFKIAMARFEGKVLEALKNMENEFKLNREQHELFFRRIRRIEMRPSISIDPMGWFFSWFGIKKR